MERALGHGRRSVRRSPCASRRARRTPADGEDCSLGGGATASGEAAASPAAAFTRHPDTAGDPDVPDAAMFRALARLAMTYAFTRVLARVGGRSRERGRSTRR
ncbi:hypothetical protein PAGU2595_012390 [Lysobacter xanthus]